ncbi:hypothetical protein KNP414_03148 [Paenibacillus mucilaginosus KNP414]|uniref:GP-PDE domain-containing protein n=1 Tax=Paenibacillus mucilaginosus (strain KNP414) TaxID=1036673 RepID=F8FB63_PAEMK|nr:hypothetical protein KNP414_03148 [Paenibacillus mucilaginosus KNP414]
MALHSIPTIRRIFEKVLGLSLKAVMLLYFIVSMPSLANAQEAGFLSKPMIAHAMGGINGHHNTNSYEAWQVNYNKGFRFFEADLILTSDDNLVARHDWAPYLYEKLEQPIPQESIPSHQTFMSMKIHDQYSPLDFRCIAQIMKHYPDMYLDIDTKELDPVAIKKQYSMIKQIAEEVEPEILDRIIPEIYTPYMYDMVMDIIPFQHVIYSIYMINDDDDTIIRFMNQHQIRVLATDPARLTGDFLNKLKENNITVYAFTVNSQSDFASLKAAGVHGVYTDFLPPC